MRHPRIRDRRPKWPFPIGYRHEPTIYKIAKDLTYISYLPVDNISGDLWGESFARAVGGRHLGSPIGHIDVVKSEYAWSVKTVKSKDPHGQKSVRIISGRNSPDYSHGITDVRADPAKTGQAVLEIWNERIDVGLSKYPIGYRSSILIRDMASMKFVYFEAQSSKYEPDDYEWSVNKRGNFEGIRREDGAHAFTWQPHGSQFTIIYQVPDYAVKFSIDKKTDLDLRKVMDDGIQFKKNWVTILPQVGSV